MVQFQVFESLRFKIKSFHDSVNSDSIKFIPIVFFEDYKVKINHIRGDLTNISAKKRSTGD